jgi:hypothetical protein
VRQLVFGVVLLLAVCSFALAAPNPEVMAPIQKFIDSFDKGDAAGAAATHSATEDLAITDEIPPHLWRGPRAFQAWAADLENYAKANGMTEEAVTIGTPTRVESNDRQAYVVVPAVYAFKQGGAAMRETAQMTFVLNKGDHGWLIHGWTWTGSKPEPAAPTKP